MRFRSLGALGASAGFAALLVTSAFGLAGGQSAKDRTTTQKSHVSAASYIVQLSDDPAAAYEGGVAGYAATAPAKGKKFDSTSNDVKKYAAYLNGKHADVAAAVGADKYYDYDFSFNGFAASMNEQQAAKLATVAGVASVTKDVLQQPTTSTTPTFLGLTDPVTGLWAKLGGPSKAGEDVIVGVVDTGIWPEHPSFSDQTDYVFRSGSSGKRSLAYGPPPASWHGSCQSGEQFSQDMCTNKLIGARYYLSGFGHFGIVKGDYKSARDHDSHGSHTSSTAAGNYGVQATGAAAPLGKISGMAPRARIADYKVCWGRATTAAAPSSDSVAAIDQAVADGVDVINFSISGSRTTTLDPVEIAFLFAAARRRVRRCVGRQRGPGASTVAHPSPWLTTVAAEHSRPGSCHAHPRQRRQLHGGVVERHADHGSVIPRRPPRAPQARTAILGGALLPRFARSGQGRRQDRGLRPGLDARVEKSQEVRGRAASGMILANTTPELAQRRPALRPDRSTSTRWTGAAVKAYVTSAGAGATATIGAVSGAAPAPKMADVLVPRPAARGLGRPAQA